MKQIFKNMLSLAYLWPCFWLLMGTEVKAQERPKSLISFDGYVTDARNGEQLIGASITAKAFNAGTTTNSFGYFSLSVPADKVMLSVYYMGFKALDTLVVFNPDKKLEIKLTAAGEQQIETVEIKASNALNRKAELGKINIPVTQIQAMPRFFGEPDLLKALQTLPGVQQGSEATSAVLVRGGSPDQNLILLDGAPVYNPSHLFGIFSSFNTYAIKNVELYKGAFPARFGGRLSSVIDVAMSDGNLNKIDGQFTVGLLASQLTLSGPIIKGKTSFLLSGRRTYHDLYIEPIAKAKDPNIKNLIFNFYDLNFKLRHKLSESDQIYLSAYSGQDNFGTELDEMNQQNNERNITKYKLGWQNLTGTLRWNHVFTPKLFSNVTLTTSKYKFGTESENILNSPILNTKSQQEVRSGITDYAAKIDLSYIPNPSHYIRGGISYIAHTFIPNSVYSKNEINSHVASTEDTRKNRLKSKEWDAYIEDDFQATENLKINVGLHASAFATQEKTYLSLQPRLNLKYTLPENYAITASYSTMAQYMHLLASNSISLPTDLWVPATAKIKPQNSSLYSLGLSKDITEKSLSLSVEGYYKTMNNVLEYNDPSNMGSNNDQKNWENKVTVGRGRSYGLELFAHKKEGKFNGWMGYTLAWADREFADVSQGKRFPYKYDRRHTLNLTGVYLLTKNIELSGNFIFQSASPFTLPTTEYQGINLNGSLETLELIEGRNNLRLQPSHRLDVGISFNKTKASGKVRTWNISVYNVYNRKNLFYFELNGRTDTKLQLKGMSLLPILPSISYSLKF